MDQNLGITNNLNPLASPKHVLNVLSKRQERKVRTSRETMAG